MLLTEIDAMFFSKNHLTIRKGLSDKCIFFSVWVFFHDHSRITRLQEKGEGISLTPLYDFHPLHRHLDSGRVITAETSPLQIASSRTRTGKLSERKSLTSKLRAPTIPFLTKKLSLSF